MEAERRSLLRSASVDNVLDESSRTVRAEDGEEGEGESHHNYYNLTQLGRSRARAASQHVLNRENLQHHDQLWTSQQGDTTGLATSFLGHTLLTAVGQDLESDQLTDTDWVRGFCLLGGN